MSDLTSSAFTELPDDDFDIEAIFGADSGSTENPFEGPAPASDPALASDPIPALEPSPAPAPVPASDKPEKKQPAAKPSKPVESKPALSEENPIAAAFAEKHTENAQKGLFEKAPIFYHKGAREAIEDSSITFEELRIRKSEDFTDLEEGKYVSWTVEYGTVRRDVKDPEGTTIASMKESIEHSKEFLEMLRKSKDKNPDCLVKPKLTMKHKGTAPYKGYFGSVEEARASDKIICLFPGSDGRVYEMRKAEQGEFIAPATKITAFQSVRAGFIPALPLIPLSLLGKIAAFFRSLMTEGSEYEALALIYWDKLKKEYFAYVPRQTVRREHVEADLSSCPYDDESRYIRYADIHSHNSMEAFFSFEDDQDERATGLYFVMGHLERFFPELRARIYCGSSFVAIDPAEVIESLDREYPAEWEKNLTKEAWESKKKAFTDFDLERTVQYESSY